MLKGIYLSLFMGPMIPVPALPEVTNALISAQVNTGGERSGFQLVFSLNKKSLLQSTLLPAGYFDPMVTRVLIIVTLGGFPNVIMDGMITGQELTPRSRLRGREPVPHGNR